jgi:hypothetical protein
MLAPLHAETAFLSTADLGLFTNTQVDILSKWAKNSAFSVK